MKLRIIVDPEQGLCVPEAKVRDTADLWLAEFIKQERPQIPRIGQFELLNQFRIYRRQGVLTDLEILYQGEIIRVDMNGNLERWPVGFLGDVAEHQMSVLAGWTEAT